MSENKKPRLADVLGVEVGEEFEVGAFGSIYHIDKYGILRGVNNIPDSYVAVFAINNPEEIRRAPRWTEREVEIAKAIKLLAPAMDYIERIAENRSELYSKLDFGAAYLQIPCIPSMKVGERIALDNIIGGNT